jgi:hypothetical protein
MPLFITAWAQASARSRHRQFAAALPKSPIAVAPA